VKAVRARAEPGDVVYAPYTVEFQYYWPEIGDRARGYVPYADRIPGRRFWLVWSHPDPKTFETCKRCAAGPPPSPPNADRMSPATTTPTSMK